MQYLLLLFLRKEERKTKKDPRWDQDVGGGFC